MDGSSVLPEDAPRTPIRPAPADPPTAYRPGYELVAEQILQLIADLRLRPGDRMPTENELAGRLGTSRTVVREAVKILSAIGRVRAQKGRGLYVADDEGMLGTARWGGFFLPTDLDHVYMLFEFRRIQEMEASRLAATRATPAELRAIEAAVETCRARPPDRADGDLFDRGDDDFHLGIAAASHNPFLVIRGARSAPATAPVQHDRPAAARSAATPRKPSTSTPPSTRPSATASRGGRAAAAPHLDNTLEDYRREIQRRVFG